MIVLVHGAANMTDKSVLMEWKGKVINKVDKKIKTLSNKTSSKFHKGVLQQNSPLNTLNDIHHQFVVTALDKAMEVEVLYLFTDDFMIFVIL